jgi:hypothetical protein
MLSIVFTWLIVAWGATACIYMLRCAWSRFPKRDVDDVIPFLYPVDLALAESLLDPATEFQYRWRLGPKQFRTAQRKRMRLYLELTRRMGHNSKVLVEYFEAEKNHPDPQRASVASTLQEKAVAVRLYVLLTRGRLLLWLFFRSAARVTMPALPDLRIACEIDGLQTYAALKSAATTAFVRLAPEEMDLLNRNL